MFAEIYDPYKVVQYEFDGVKSRNPYVRPEVLSHLSYKRLDFPYIHPSWQNDGEAVLGLDLCFLLINSSEGELSTSLIIKFLERYYSVLSNKPKFWQEMIKNLEGKNTIALLPI